MRKRLTILMAFLSLITFFLSINLFQSCKHEPDNLSNLPTVCFNDVQTIFSSSCAMSGCHTGNSREGGFNPSNYTSIMESIKPGDPWGSKAYTIICSPNNPNMMPPKGHDPISPKDRTTIEVWILQGAKDTCNIAK